ncbi:MAG: hypothetical protein K0R66_644 [Gammaproteobacteria bacterium]|nr:hypothetical protein [Gammaproteobacteria bacterium]
MKAKALILNIVLAPAIALAATPSDLPSGMLNISGEYQCTGFDPYSQQNYSSLLTISKVSERIYSIYDQTLVARSPDTSKVDVFSDREIGILNDNVLAIAYQNRRAPMEQGVEHVTFAPDGRSFFGVWAQMGGTVVGTESCHKLPAIAQS